MDIREAQRSGIKAVFICCRRGSDNRTIKLGVVADRNIEATITGIHPGLFGYRVKAALHLVPGGCDVAGSRHAAEGEAAARRHAVLLAVVFVAVLLAAHQQVMTHVGDDFIAVDLRPIEYGVVPALDSNGLAAVDSGFSPVGTVAFIFAVGGVDVGEDADAGTLSCANTHTHTAAAAAVLAAGLLGIGGAAKNDVVLSVQQRIASRFQLAAGNQDIATVRAVAFSVRSDGKSVARIQGAACYRIALGVLLRSGFLRCERETDAHCIRVAGSGSEGGSLTRLDPGQSRLGGLQRFQTTIAGLFCLLRICDSIIDRAADSTGQRQGQPAALLLEGFITGAFVMPRFDNDAAAVET